MKKSSVRSALVLIAVVQGGCGITVEDTGDAFRKLMDSQVGQNVYNTRYRAPTAERSSKDPGKVEFLYLQHKCEWVFVVDNITGVIESWRYISSPSLCRVQASGAW